MVKGEFMKVQFIALGLALTCSVAAAQTQTQTQKPPQSQTQSQGRGATPTTGQSTPTPAPAPAPATPPLRGRLQEEVVARVNNEIITSVDLEKAKGEITDEIKQDCAEKKCTPEQIQEQIDEGQKNALRDLIDGKLLVQRAKDLNISVETEVIKELDRIRVQYNLETMEDLEKAVTNSGENYDDYKDTIRDHFLRNEVIEREVYSKVGSAVDHAQIQKYYDEHKEEFQSPELVYIREILVSTDGKPESDWPALEKKANDYRTRVINGEDFGELAKHFSDGSTAKQGGELGKFERGMLSKSYEDQVFKLNRKEMTSVIHAQNGFLIIQVEERYEAGTQPIDKVQSEIIGRIASKQVEPKLRDYLATLRKDSYVEVHPGYTDTAAVPGESITETNTSTIDPVTTKARSKPKKHKRFLIF
jgi:peptidyl-prolyl cis-trans isomerase SurA